MQNAKKPGANATEGEPYGKGAAGQAGGPGSLCGTGRSRTGKTTAGAGKTPGSCGTAIPCCQASVCDAIQRARRRFPGRSGVVAPSKQRVRRSSGTSESANSPVRQPNNSVRGDNRLSPAGGLDGLRLHDISARAAPASRAAPQSPGRPPMLSAAVRSQAAPPGRSQPPGH
jgi:hypothetical protein